MFGDPNGLTKDEQDTNGRILRAYAKANAQKLGFPVDHGPIGAPSFHPMFRIGPHGDMIVDVVVELVESAIVTDDELGKYTFRSGVTLLIWQEALKKGERPAPQIHYVIQKHRTAEREKRQRTHMASLSRVGRHDEHDRIHPGAWKIDFGLIHTGL